MDSWSEDVLAIAHMGSHTKRLMVVVRDLTRDAGAMPVVTSLAEVAAVRGCSPQAAGSGLRQLAAWGIITYEIEYVRDLGGTPRPLVLIARTPVFATPSLIKLPPNHWGGSRAGAGRKRKCFA